MVDCVFNLTLDLRNDERRSDAVKEMKDATCPISVLPTKYNGKEVRPKIQQRVEVWVKQAFGSENKTGVLETMRRLLSSQRKEHALLTITCSTMERIRTIQNPAVSVARHCRDESDGGGAASNGQALLGLPPRQREEKEEAVAS